MLRVIDHEIRLIPYYQNVEIALPWYQNLEVCKQVDNIDFVYDEKRLNDMYTYLSTHGDCFYVEYQGTLIGDVSLMNDEIAIVICKEYQNQHIGRRCVQEMIDLAKEKGLKQVKAEIYPFNKQSQAMFQAIGFKQVEEEVFVLELK